jgi:hypothetical protein
MTMVKGIGRFVINFTVLLSVGVLTAFCASKALGPEYVWPAVAGLYFGLALNL